MAANVVHLQLLLALAAHRLCALNLHTTNTKVSHKLTKTKERICTIKFNQCEFLKTPSLFTGLRFSRPKVQGGFFTKG